jgi:hypothetical protein
MLGKARVAVCSLLLLLTVGMSVRPVTAAADRLPDLRLKRLRELTVERTADGKRVLRFTSVVVNGGVGRLIVTGTRPNPSSPMTVKQVVDTAAGGSRTQTTGATMIFGGDGHQHWHVRKLVTSSLRRLPDNMPLKYGTKLGYCFYDNEEYNLELPGAPQARVYTRAKSCQGGAAGLATRMGLSVGWGDRYAYHLPDQYIDITGLAAGDYRLYAKVDANNWFLEQSDTNNVTWVDIRLSATGQVRILKYGPAA